MDLDRLKIEKEHFPSSRFPWAVAIGVGLAAFLLGFVCCLLVVPRRLANAPKVTTTLVGSPQSDIARAFTAGGWIEVAAPEYPVVVSGRISQRLEALMVKQGDSVAPGQVVAQLYEGDIQARLRSAQAAAREQEERLRLARANHERSRQVAAGALSREELDRDAAAFAMAREAHAAALAQQELAEKELSYCMVRVPSNLPPLRVLEVFQSPGAWVSLEKGAAIVSLYDPSNLQARVDVPQSNLRFVSVGQDVIVRTEAHPTRDYKGKVIRLDPLALLAKNTVTVRIRIEDPDDLLFPEMVGHASFLAPRRERQGAGSELTIAADAVVREGAATFVFVLEGGKARRTAVTLGEASGRVVGVTRGLSSGQRVITGGIEKLSDGIRVEAD